MKQKLLLSEALGLSPLLDEQQASEVLNVSRASLRRWRLVSRGPRYRKVGTRVLYEQKDLVAFIEFCPSGGAEVA